MILTYDIGNTNIVIALVDNGSVLQSYRLRSDIEKTSDEFGVEISDLLSFGRINLSQIKTAMISSVVPRLTPIIVQSIKQYLSLPVYVVSIDSPHGLTIKLKNPNELGMDRLMTAVASFYLYKSDCITIDFGTATTIEALSQEGEFLGGTIAAGVNLSLKALHMATAKLPFVEIAKPSKILGNDTVTAIQSGVFNGYSCMVDGMISKIIPEVFSSSSNVKIIATGGLGEAFAKNSTYEILYEPNLIAYGLNCIYNRLGGSC